MCFSYDDPFRNHWNRRSHDNSVVLLVIVLIIIWLLLG